MLGGSVGGDGAGANGFSLCGLNGTDRHGRPGDGDLQLECRHQHADGDDHGGTAPARRCSRLQVTDPATGAYTVTLLDNVLHAGGPNDEATDATAALTYVITDADGSTRTGTLTITFDDDAPTATAEASQDVAEGATVTGTLDFVAGRRRRHGDAHRRHAAGVQPGRRRLLAGDRHRRRLHQGEGGRLVLVHGGRGDGARLPRRRRPTR